MMCYHVVFWCARFRVQRLLRVYNDLNRICRCLAVCYSCRSSAVAEKLRVAESPYIVEIFILACFIVLLLFIGPPFVKRFALCYWTVVCLSCLSVTLVYCGQRTGWIRMPLGMEVGLGPGHTVLDGDAAPPKWGTAPNFWPMSFLAKPLDGSRCHLVWR